MPSGALKYGIADQVSMDRALKNFAHAAFQEFSFCCTPVELLSNDGKETTVCTASGFFWRYNNRSYLISNWHVVSGRSPFTGEVISGTGYVPTEIAFYGWEIILNDGIVRFRRPRYSLKFNEDLLQLLEKPPVADGESIDIWAAPIADGIVIGREKKWPGGTISCFLNEHQEKLIQTTAGDQCFILGYPLQNYDGLMTPIWKRGSIASDTTVGVDGKPIFLIDAAVTSSMSGSPVLRKITLFAGEDSNSGVLQERTAFQVIGVYAGRLQRSDLTATNLGYAWYRTLIDDVIAYYNYGAFIPCIIENARM